MAYHWIPPNSGTIKINVHGSHSLVPSDVGNTTGKRAVFRNSTSSPKHVTVGTIPSLSRIGNQLWEVYAPLRRAKVMGSQIDILLRDRSWTCVIAYVFPTRNHVVRFLERLGMNVCDRLYTLNCMIGAMEELIDWDMGLGIDHPDYVDVLIRMMLRIRLTLM
ncbi:hypothetical protein DCAR_0519020 [Daucus carota subsp. sativus]|uniref:Uncharacterized protein n=1 Tax=Daucus carota subsp. sativus TaxID=79200 RepID=A0A164XNL0_DAUCS|nr:hypothetical protein DCAR_0519020 [Daucus carota subsp. sativus]